MRDTTKIYATLTKKGSVQLYYRYFNIKYNDGTFVKTLQYHSTCGGGWFGCRDTKNIEPKLIEINNTKI